MQSCLMMSFELNLLLVSFQYTFMALILMFSLCTLVMIFGTEYSMSDCMTLLFVHLCHCCPVFYEKNTKMLEHSWKSFEVNG